MLETKITIKTIVFNVIFVAVHKMIGLISGSYLVDFNSTHAELDSSVILFQYLFFIKFNSENRDSHAHVDENIDKIALIFLNN